MSDSTYIMGIDPDEDAYLVRQEQRRIEADAEHLFNPSCPCRECHLEAEAEDATWD